MPMNFAHHTRNIVLIPLLLITLLLSGCGVNPVTGKRQITLMSQAKEISIGKQQYGPSQQSQGGAYVIDQSLNEYINRIGQSLAKHSGQDLPYEFVVLNNSVPNAWALPGGKIAINRGLLLLFEDEAQLAAVLGHEVVHAAARHTAEQHATGMGIQIFTAILQTQTDNGLYRQGAALGGGAAHAYYGRDNELEADEYGIQYMVAEGYDPQGAVELQQKLLNLSKNKSKSNWMSRLFASHPPSAERVKKNKILAAKYPKGKRNKAAYQRAIKQLLKDKDAYELNDKALAKAKDKQWDSALSLVNQAIKKQPKEARFYITKGRLLEQKNQSAASISAFTQAVNLEPNYFASQFYRGIAYQKTKKYDAATKDLLASNQLLETATANYYLGEISLSTKQQGNAINYYRRAAKGGGEVAKAATARLKSLGVQ